MIEKKRSFATLLFSEFHKSAFLIDMPGTEVMLIHVEPNPLSSKIMTKFREHFHSIRADSRPRLRGDYSPEF